MRSDPDEFPSWTRHEFRRAGLVATDVATLGACAHPGTWPAAAAADPASDLDNLARGVRGRLLRGSSPGCNEAGRVWNLAYDRRPLAMVRGTAYPLRGTGLSSLVAAEWKTPNARAGAGQWVAETGAALRPFARRAYVNFLPPSPPERIREVYGTNYPRLARIKATYDPAILFRSNQNVLPGTRS